MDGVRGKVCDCLGDFCERWRRDAESVAAGNKICSQFLPVLRGVVLQQPARPKRQARDRQAC
jgi:hypothetical protein